MGDSNLRFAWFLLHAHGLVTAFTSMNTAMIST